MSRLKDVCFDCADPWTLATWWAPVLDYGMRPHTAEDLAELRAQGLEGPQADPSVALDPIEGSGPTIWFNLVPEAKTVKNRVHLDVFGDVAELEEHGATVLHVLPDWTVMSDPEGNEFCVFARRSAS
ncbi:MAG: VOC family protein [Acidimicrobiia bacterium]|nr:VOC family protein [Acidimicrobiia bacterium]